MLRKVFCLLFLKNGLASSIAGSDGVVLLPCILAGFVRFVNPKP